MEYELIHINLALAKYPLFSDEMNSFWEQEKAIYEVAKTFAGYVRDIEFPDRFSVFPEPYIFNATAWKNVEDLKEFVYTGMHAMVLKDRKRWFTETSYPKYTLFWVEAEFRLTEEYASKKLLSYAENGPGQDAFDFKTVFSKPDWY